MVCSLARRSAPEVFLGDAPTGDSPSFNKVLQAHVIDALGREDDVGPRIEDALYALFGDVALPLPDLLELGRVINDHLDAHVHASLPQGHQSGRAQPRLGAESDRAYPKSEQEEAVCTILHLTAPIRQIEKVTGTELRMCQRHGGQV